MNIELSNTDVVFIYGHFQKQLAEIDKIASAPNCPFDKAAIEEQKALYISVAQKLAEQLPDLKKLDG